MLSQLSSHVTKSIEEANNEIEQTWSSIYEITNLFKAKECSEFAFRRLISYNPETPKATSAPTFKQAVDEIAKYLNAFSSKIETDPDNLATWIQIAHCYLLLSDFPNAYSAYSNVIRLNKNAQIDDAYFWYGIGSVYQHFKYNKIAQKYLTNTLQIAPQLQQIADVKFRLALVSRSLQIYDDAITQLKSILSLPPPRLTEDDIKFQLAFTYQLDGKNDKADQIYTELYEKHPNSPDLIQQYAWFLSLQDDKKYFDRADQIIKDFDPTDPTLKFVTARIAMKQQDMPTAYHRYCGCISYWSDSPLFWCGLGVLYFKNEQMQDAVVAFQRALYLKGELVEAWANLGLIFELQKDTNNSLKIYQAAIQKCSDNEKLKERLAALQSGRTKRVVDPEMILEVNDSRFFVQVAERIATEYIATPPFIPAHQVGSDKNTELLFGELKLSYNSLFAT